MNGILAATLMVGGTGLLIGILLGIAGKKFYVEVIKHELYTGHIGDGKIFIYDIDNVIRVRTGDEGVDAL